jgi:hypothetical protein
MNPGELFDCQCVISRPKTSRLYATRWRVYLAPYTMNLRCLDCGRIHSFQLTRNGVQRTTFDRGYEDDRKEIREETQIPETK